MSIKDALEEQAKKIKALEELLPEHSAKPQPTVSDIASAMYTVKKEMEEIRKEQVAAELELIYKGFTENAPKIDSYLIKTAELVLYTVEFIELRAGKLMELMQVVPSARSEFKKRMCMTYVLASLPHTDQVSPGLISGLIDLIVELKNDDIHSISGLEPIPSEPKDTSTTHALTPRNSKKNWLSRLQGNKSARS